MYIDPTGHWEEGDSSDKYTDEQRNVILEATKEYIKAKERGDEDGMKVAHDKAEAARNGVYEVSQSTFEDIINMIYLLQNSNFVIMLQKSI